MLDLVRAVDEASRGAEGFSLTVIDALAGVLVWAGATLLLSSWPRLTRPGLLDRLRPFHPGGMEAARRRGLGDPAFSLAGTAGVIGSMVAAAGDRLAAVFGVSEPVARRLRRLHSAVDPKVFRMRQGAAAGASMIVAAMAVLVLRLPGGVSAFFVLGAPVLAFLAVEQRLSAQSERWKREVASELPVVEEQLAMLLNAGFSLTGALQRICELGRGCVASDVETVLNRVRQGLSDADALEEWADIADVQGVRRLVRVLSLHQDASDMGRLVSAEARSARRELHRRTTESIERRAQQVWVPVTVATLVPGVILLAVPFLSALRLFSNA